MPFLKILHRLQEEWSTPQHPRQYRPVVLADRKQSFGSSPSCAPTMAGPQFKSPTHQLQRTAEPVHTRHNVSEDDTWMPGAPLTSYSSLLDTLRLGGSEADSSQSVKSDISEPTFKRPRYGRRRVGDCTSLHSNESPKLRGR